MKQNILNEEISRILEMMNLEKSIIIENIGDDIAKKILKRLGVSYTKGAEISALKRFIRNASKSQLDDLLSNELRIVSDDINKFLDEGLPENYLIDSMKRNYSNLFDDAGTFERHIKDIISTRGLKKGINLDQVLKSRNFLDNPIVKTDINYYKNIVKDNWEKLQSFYRTGVKDSEKLMVDFISENYPGPVYNIFQRFIRSEIGRKVKIYGGSIFGTLFLLRVARCWYETKEKKTNQGFGFCLGEGSVNMLKEVIGFSLDTVGGIASGLSTNTQQPTETSGKTYTNDPDGFIKWCNDNNISGCGYDSEYTEYYDSENFLYKFDETKKTWGKK